MNVVQVKRHIHKLYQTIQKAVRKEILVVLEPLQTEIYEEALALGFDGNPEDLDEGWVEEFFEEYNPVTKYVFKNELVRKEARLLEAVLASVAERAQSYKTAENLLTRQVKQNAIDLEDALAMAVYKAVGVEKVKWIAEDDSKTCGECKALDGKVFPLGEAPPKAHPNCRCYYVPVND